jgi:light-regulated signal transduction histidine kinase (bacteriophytochrome)
LYGLRPEEDLWSAYELWRRHLHPDDRAAAELAIREGMAGNSPFDTEFRIRWGDGSVHHIRGTGRVTRDGAGRALRFVGANWDVTKEALKNRALQDAAEALTRRAAELRQSNEELTEFAMFASHDLQEPLRMVGSYTALLSARYMGKLDSDADEFIALALDGVQRMQRLIRDLLAYSRVGTQGMRMTDTPSGDALRLALRNLRGAIEESGARVTHDQLPRVMADELQICQLFQNLIGNAIKYQRPETPVVHVSADKNAGGKWEFSVRDNGIGIAPENFDQIFGMLRRLPGSEKISGTGIGLAICKRIVERHGGRISVESQPGIGSIFRFTLAGVSKRV